MTKKRDVENIRQKNLEDNQRFLEQLLLTTARNDFLKSARSIHRHHQSNQIKKIYQKVERTTRYSEKVKSGEISSFVPEWQRLREEKKKEAEKRLLEKQRRTEEYLFQQELRKIEKQIKYEEREKMRCVKRKPPRWTLFYRNSINGNPYQRVFKPRNTNVGQKVEQNLS